MMESPLATKSTGARTPSSRLYRAFERLLSAAFIVILILSAAATAGIMFGSTPPLFNQKEIYYTVGNTICLVALLVLAATLIVAEFIKRLNWVRKIALLLFLSLLTLEVLLFVFDRYFISAVGSPLETAFRNVWIQGEPVWLRQPTTNSPFGFRNQIMDPSQKEDYRIVFLGNSFVSGSGTTFATNYPQATAAALRSELPDKNIGVLSAGVDGFGSKEDRLIYEYLLQKGYRFDFVVVNFNMGSDPTNDVPGSLRKAVAGEPQRFPDNWFLRSFYPLDTYIFRYGYYLKNVFDPRFGAVDDKGPKDATCELSSNFIKYANQRMSLYYAPGAEKRVYLDYNVGELFKIADLAKANHTKLLVVLLPDRFSVLPSNQPGLEGGELDRSWIQRYMKEKIGQRIPMLDLAPYFKNRPDLFGCNDLHWNDPGNLEGARRVSDYLVQSMKNDSDGLSSATTGSN